MPALLAIVGLVFVFLSFITTSVDQAVARLDTTDDNILLEQIAAYQAFAKEYAEANPGASGTISDAALGVPAWFTRTSGIENTVQGGAGYAWFDAGTPARASRIAARAQGTARAGVKVAGRLQQPGETTPGPVLPAAIPEGVVVVTR